MPATDRSGARKLAKVKAISAGVSVWGMGQVQNMCLPKECLPMDQFLWAFAEMVGNDKTLEDVGRCLAAELNRRVKPGEGDGGFHLAGYTKDQGRRFPAIYHVYPHPSHEPPGSYDLHLDWPFEHWDRTLDEWLAYIEGGGFAWLMNVDSRAFAEYSSSMNKVMDSLQRDADPAGAFNLRPPYKNDLEFRGRFLKLQIEAICELYRLRTGLSIIAKPVSWLTISETGIQDCEIVGI